MQRLMRFGLTGALTTSIAFLVFVGLTHAGVHYEIANALAWASALIVGFVTNRRFTFQIEGAENRRRDFALYVIGAVLQLILAMAGYALLIGKWRLSPAIAFVPNLVMTTTFNFLFLRYVAFRRVGGQR